MPEIFKHFYELMQRLDPKAHEIVWRSGAFVVQRSQEGHSCLPLPEFADKRLVVQDEEWLEASNGPMPLLAEWRSLLVASPLVGGPLERNRPFVLDSEDRLYLSRNYDYEVRLAAEVGRRAREEGASAQELAPLLTTLFGAQARQEIDWQRVAAATAALKRLCIVSGGPGTGKTHTVVKIMAILQMLEPDRPLSFGLAAPTGKAASRLQESIQACLQQLPPEVVGRLDPNLQARTIHRLLGTKRHSPYFRHDRNYPLPLDVLIIDEASMVDLAMMVKLLEAVPNEARIVMLGDKDQLSSVEAGRVLADLCQTSGNLFSADFYGQLVTSGAVPEGTIPSKATGRAVDDCLVYLEKSYRFGAQSPIGRLARFVLAGDEQAAAHCLVEENDFVDSPLAAMDNLADQVCMGFGGYLDEKEPLSALERFKRFRLLCPHRQGVLGVAHLNQWVETVLGRANRIEKRGEWYAGKPVMITGNHYAMGLFNGDVGLTLYDEQGRLRIWFEEGRGQVRSISPQRLPAHETAYAMTVHKSQGSEFERVVLVLPNRLSTLITRELLYTAITRAKHSFELWGSLALFTEGVRQGTLRNTGLSEKISALGKA